MLDPIILGSARRHGISDDGIIHAYWNPFRVFELDDLVMIVGDDGSGTQLEVGVVHQDGIDLIVHVMRARKKFLEI